ncbi:MAG: hopanoid-associated sugar epimerase [Armatimonadota bacterium]|nr:NAD-dependent epimerase/dehydratase family protein [bacterium]
MKRVFVTGGTGFVGAHVIRKLIERGEQVTALVRPFGNPTLLKGLDIQTVTGDITDFDSIYPALVGTDTLYHIAADYRLWASDPREIYYNNLGGTLNVLEAALRRNVRRVVYTSTVGCLGIPKDGSPGVEDTPVVRDELVGHYKKSKFDAEKVALEYAGKGLDVVIVNPSTPVGPGDVKPTPTGKIIVDFLKGKMQAYVDTGLNLISVEDVAEGHLLAADKGVRGQKYILGNCNLTLKQILDILASVTSRKAPSMCIPHWVALMAALADTAYNSMLTKPPNIPVEGVLMARKKMFFCSQKAVVELGLPQSPVEDALAAAAKWFQSHGYCEIK